MESPYTSSTNGWSFYTSLWESSLSISRSMAGLQDTSSSPHQSSPSRPPGFLLTLSQTEPGSPATCEVRQAGRKHTGPGILCVSMHSPDTSTLPSLHTLATVATVTPEGRGLSIDPEEDGLTYGFHLLSFPSSPGSALDPYSSCNKNCECQTDSFTPVCGAARHHLPVCLLCWLQQHGIADFLTGWDGAGSTASRSSLKPQVRRRVGNHMCPVACVPAS